MIKHRSVSRLETAGTQPVSRQGQALLCRAKCRRAPSGVLVEWDVHHRVDIRLSLACAQVPGAVVICNMGSTAPRQHSTAQPNAAQQGQHRKVSVRAAVSGCIIQRTVSAQLSCAAWCSCCPHVPALCATSSARTGTCSGRYIMLRAPAAKDVERACQWRQGCNRAGRHSNQAIPRYPKLAHAPTRPPTHPPW
jgi:hypothetical protein